MPSVGKLGSGFVKSANWIGAAAAAIACSVLRGGIHGGMQQWSLVSPFWFTNKKAVSGEDTDGDVRLTSQKEVVEHVHGAR